MEFIDKQMNYSKLQTKNCENLAHAAGCERILSSLGWFYGKWRNRLGLSKVENMYKLSAYYHVHAKQQLPYYSMEKKVMKFAKFWLMHI